MILVVLASVLTVPMSLAMAFFAMKAALWLVSQAKEARLASEALELPAHAGVDNVVVLRPAAGRTARAA